MTGVEQPTGEELDEIVNKHVDYYEAVFVICETCQKEWPTGWSELRATQHEAARHWLNEHGPDGL